MALALFGVGAILAASSQLFLIVKWAGVFYMAYLGGSQIMSARKNNNNKSDKGICENELPQPSGDISGLSSAGAGFVTAVMNPKAIIFYVAFISQFLDPTANIYTQFAIVVATSTLIVGAVLGTYALMALQARKAFQSARARRCFEYTGGGFLVGGSVFMATTR